MRPGTWSVSILTHPYGRMQPPTLWTPPEASTTFQSSPTLTGGCNSVLPVEEGDAPERFNPHPPLRADATLLMSNIVYQVFEFQSSPTLTGGCNSVLPVEEGDAPERFNPHPPLRADATLLMSNIVYQVFEFQSSPTLTGGCNLCILGVERSPSSCFNPHPPLRADATLLSPGAANSHSPFQSSPTLTGGCNFGIANDLLRSASWFQSSPTLTGGCNVDRGDGRPVGLHVSILTHPYGRMQQLRRRRNSSHTSGFNPHPPLRADATSYAGRLWEPYSSVFQSSPTLTGGCNLTGRSGACKARTSFNPHPPLRADATTFDVSPKERAIIVSILTHPYGRMQHGGRLGVVVEVGVSILTHPYGRMQRRG